MARTPTDYQLLAAFAAVADERSFTKAAKKLGIVKGTVSRAIAELEGQLGTELVHRTTHAVSLSTAGIALYERVAPLLAALDQAVLKLPDRAEVPSGKLRIAAPPDFGQVLLPEILVHFGRRYPEVSVDVRLRNGTVDLVSESFDLALQPTSVKLKDSSLASRRLGRIGVDFFAAPSYLARSGRPRHIGAADHTWIVHSAMQATIKFPREAAARFIGNDFLLIRDLAKHGGGLGLLPHFVASPGVRDGTLERVPLGEQPALAGSLFLVYPSSGQVPKKVAAFRDFLVEWLKRAPLA